MTKESLFNVVETEAAAQKIPPRQLWVWTLEAILNDALDAETPNYGPDAYHSAPEYWHNLVSETRKGMKHNPNVPPPASFQDVTVEKEKFQKWLKQKIHSQAPGPKTARPRMRYYLDKLNIQFPTPQLAYDAVLKSYKEDHNGQPPGRGWTEWTFRRFYKVWLKEKSLANP